MNSKKITNNLKKKSNKIILELKNIKKYFPGTKALDGVDLKIRKGKVTVLMGENGAGKSTILKIIFGILKKTSGTIIYKGKEVEFIGPKDALNNGVAMVHQELQQVLTTSVMDNIWLGRFPKIGPFVNKAKMIEDTNKIFKDLNIKDVKPTDPISKLSVSRRQIVEIAKAVSYNSEVLILDEPTSSLTENEVNHLFKIIERLKQKGVAILFVSHKMSEIFKIGDYITVFRDGKYINEKTKTEYTVNSIIRDMVGRDMSSQFPKKHIIKKNAQTILKLENFSSIYSHVQDINLELKKGEILGVAGLVGSGRTELAEMIFGIRKLKNGSKITYKEKEIQINNPKQAMNQGIALLTEDRKQDGIFGCLDIEFNTTIGQINAYKWPWGFLNKTLMKTETQKQIDVLKTKVSSQKQNIESLSGGNQQKVLISRWLLRQPDLFIMDDPTRGIDVGAKYSIYELIKKLAESDKSVIMISSEMTELIGVCNRIAVMSNGKLAGFVQGQNMNQENIMALAAKHY